MSGETRSYRELVFKIQCTTAMFTRAGIRDTRGGSRPAFVDFARHTNADWQVQSSDSQRLTWRRGVSDSTMLALEGDFLQNVLSMRLVKISPGEGGDEASPQVESFVLSTVMGVEVNSVHADSDLAKIWGVDQDGKKSRVTVFSDGEFEIKRDISF